MVSDKTFFASKRDWHKETKGIAWEKIRSKKSFWTRQYKEFCKKTDLHGYKYVVKEDLTVTERMCWVIAILFSTAIAVYFVFAAFRWYARNAIITVIESTQSAIWGVPFPAVTICDLNIISRKAALNFVSNLSLPSNVTAESVFKMLRLAPLIHSSYTIDDEQKKDLSFLQNILDINNVSIAKLFRNLSPVASCANLIEKCMWKNTPYKCEHLFQQVFSSISLCCTFNYYAIEQAHFSEPLLYEVPLFESPRLISSCGYQTALTVVIKNDPKDYYSVSEAAHGVLVFVDNTYNVLDDNSPVRKVNPSTEVMIALSPERTYTNPRVRSFLPEERKCYYEDEVKIDALRRYSSHNCIAYEKIKAIERVCKCIPFFFPVKEKRYRHCNFKDLACLESIPNSLNEETSNDIVKPNFQCLPECHHYRYLLTVSLGNVANTVHNRRKLYSGHISDNRSLLNVFFNDLVSTRYRRDVYLNWENVLASFGGLLSLILGFTLIAGFDIIIFFVVRIAYVIIKERRRNCTPINKRNIQNDIKKGG